MLSPKDFVARWGTDYPLQRFGKKTLERLVLADEDKEFLAQAGLPESAAPFLNFDVPTSGELPTVADTWDQPKEFRRYRVIGGDGSGNPLAIDEQSKGEVVCLDHESDFARVFMNKTIRQFAESLLAYQKMVRDAVAANGQDAYLNGQVPVAAREELKRELARIDPAAIAAGCFWHAELQNLDANAS
jgi:hypothetical protein